MTVDLHDTNECDSSLKEKFDKMINNRYNPSDSIKSEGIAAKQNLQSFRNYLIDKLKLYYSTLYGLLVSLDNSLYKTEYKNGCPVAFIDVDDVNSYYQLRSVIKDIIYTTDMLEAAYLPPVSGDTKPDNINFKSCHGDTKTYKIYYSDNTVVDIVIGMRDVDVAEVYVYKRFNSDD